MSVNPWLVENIQAFSSLNCPECVFKTKTEVMFKYHAISNHPLSCVLFEKSTKTIGKEEAMSESELEQLAEKGHKTLEELMYSEFGPPEPLNPIQVTLDNQNYNSYGAERVDTTNYIMEEKPREEIMYPENNGISVKCKDSDMKIKKKPISVSESLPESILANYRATISAFNSTDSLIKKSMKCPYPNCDFETLRKSSLDAHIKSHTDCKFCGEMFPGKIKLAVHLTKCQAKPPKPEKRYLCDFCSKDCKSRQTKWRHMKICKTTPILFPQETPKVLSPKEAPGNFMCACCNNDFSYLCQKDLNEHRQMCFKKFGKMVEPVNLERQKSVPSGILLPDKALKVSYPNFVCEFCNNDFSYLCRKDLNVHRQMCSTNFNKSGDTEIKLLSKEDPLMIT